MAGAGTRTPDEVADAIRAFRLRFSNEDELQRGIAEALSAAGIGFKREQDLGDDGQIDFLCEGGVGVEAKVKDSPSSVARQLIRYAGNASVSSLVLVTAKARLGASLPELLLGKRMLVVGLWRQML